MKKYPPPLEGVLACPQSNHFTNNNSQQELNDIHNQEKRIHQVQQPAY